MLLEYTDNFKAIKVKAVISTTHSSSSYGQPVIISEKGGIPIDVISWKILKYRVVKATQKELKILQKIGFIKEEAKR
jgi:hypothetical protein